METWRSKLKWLPVMVLGLGNFLIWYIVSAESRNNLLTVAFLDIGQGDAIFIEAPNGNQILLDGGRGRQILEALSGVMPFYDRSLDLIIASHPDADHVGGLVDVLENYEFGAFIEPGVAADTQVWKRLKQLVRDEGGKLLLARRGMKIILDETRGIYLQILFPDRDPSNWETNEASIVAKLTYGKQDFLLIGDSPAKIEKYLVGLEGKNLQSEVLKTGHHGSKTSSSEVFLGTVNPDYSIISVGEGNSYGHPHPEVLERLSQFPAKILRTDEQGTIIFKTDGEMLTWRIQ